MSSITALTRVSGALDPGGGWGAEEGLCRGHRLSPDCPLRHPPPPADAQGLWTWTRWQMKGSGRHWRASLATLGRRPVSC